MQKKIPLEYFVRVTNSKKSKVPYIDLETNIQEFKSCSKDEVHKFIEKYATVNSKVDIWSRDLNDAFYTNY